MRIWWELGRGAGMSHRFWTGERRDEESEGNEDAEGLAEARQYGDIRWIFRGSLLVSILCVG